MMYIRHHRYNKLACLLCWLSGVKYKALIFLCILAIVLITAIACSDNSTNNSSPAPCFPVQKAGLDEMESLGGGKLELDNGCLRMDKYLLIWPHGFSLRTEGEEILVIDDGGQVVARVGDKITVGGGEITDSSFNVPGKTAKEFIEESIIGQPLPDDCTGPYWIVGETVKTVN